MSAALKVLSVLILWTDAFASEPRPFHHACEIYYFEQVVDPVARTQSYINGKSEMFGVSQAEHVENIKRIIEVKNEAGELLKKAEVNTGTYVESSEGDIVQAYASMEILGKKEDVGVVAHIMNRFSRASRAITGTREGKLHAINFSIKCSLIEQGSDKALEKSKIPN